MVDENRTQELEVVLEKLSHLIIDYVKKADSPDGSIGQYYSPADLAKQMPIRVDAEGHGIEGLLSSANLILDTSVVTWHQTFLEKLYAGTNPVGMASDMLLSILNTNSHVFTASPALTLIEKYIGRKYARMFGFDGPRAGGLTFPGGSYSNITALHMARSIQFPETKTEGCAGHKFAVFTSSHCHYSVEKAAILMGLGSKSVIKVNVHETGEMDTDDLERRITEAKRDGYIPLAISATAGTTVYGSFDDFETIGAIARKHDIWFHIDGSWGANFIFSDKQKHKLKGSHLANSLTSNPHKMLGVPCTCSFLLVPDERVFQEANSLQAAYLFHNGNTDDDENYDLADGTMGCGRRADALKLYLGWQWYGTNGYRERIDHAVDMTAYLAQKVQDTPNFFLLSTNPPPCLQTCFFYSPSGKLGTASENTAITRKIAVKLLKNSKFLVDYSPHPVYGEFFRVVLNAPSVEKSTVDDLIKYIQEYGSDE